MKENLSAIIDFELPIGEGDAEDLLSESALAGPFRKLFNEGKPIGTINYVFFEHGQRHYVLGSLCYTPAKRILFFPAFNKRNLAWYTTDKGRYDARNMNAIIEHFTLEPKLDDWHIKVRKDSNRLPSKHTRKFEDDIIFWFAIGLDSPVFLEKLPRRTVWFVGPSSIYEDEYSL